MTRFFKLFFICCFAAVCANSLFSAEKSVPTEKKEVVRIEMASVVSVSSAVSRLGNCIAPDFKNSVALLTVALMVGGNTFGMDLTRPVSIVFYKAGVKPSLRITAYAVPNVQVIREKVTLWNVKLHARLKNGLSILSSDDLNDGSIPVSEPGGKLSGSLLFMEAIPDKVDFTFCSLNAREGNRKLLFQALDELMRELETLRLSFRTDDRFLVVGISMRARKHSALESYFSRPLPEKGTVESFAGADSLFLFRLPGSEALCRYGTEYFFRNRQNALLPLLPSAVTGFAVLSSRRDAGNSSVKLMLGIRPSRSPAIADTAAGLGYTPYPNLYQAVKSPPLFCAFSGNRLAFYYTDPLSKDSLEKLLKPVSLPLNAGESPFAFYDLSRPDKPVAELRFRGDTAEMLFRAPDEWFALLPPLMNVPLHKIGVPGNLQNNP